MTTKLRRNGTRPETDVGFRLLDSANNINNYYLSVVNYEPPEPPRAPEPYKLASSTMARAHRKSSFVILAETDETSSSKSPNDSPTYHGQLKSARSRSPLSPSRAIRGGRASPFRPRGFKGPPPHAQSRPPSPPPPAPQRRRFVRPKSLSQGNSPRKQSLIPQPRGGLTTMKNKNQKSERERWERRGSRKFTNLPRTSSLKALQPVRRPLIEANRPAVQKGKASKSVTKLPKQAIKSPTKIPIRNPSNSNNNRFVKISNDSNSKIKKPETSHLQQQQPQQQQQQPLTPSVPLSMKNVPTPLDSSPLMTDESVIMGGGSGASDNSIKKFKVDEEEGELGLVDLLKQSSGASGTSSVVNATTTTAVQPLRIDAATILPQPDIFTEKKDFINSANPSKPSNSPNAIKKEISSFMEKKDVETSQTVTAVASVEPVKQESIIQQVQSSKSTPPKPTTSKNEVKVDRDELRNPVEVEAMQTFNSQDTNSIIDEIQTAQKTTKTGSKGQSNGTSPRSTENNVNPEVNDRQIGSSHVQGSTITNDKLRNHGSEASLKSSKSNDLSTGSVESIRSTDTGVSLNTVRGIHGVSSAREKRGTHTVKRSNEIETLSGNVMDYERGKRPENGEPA